MQIGAPPAPSAPLTQRVRVSEAVRRNGLLLLIVILGIVLRFADLGKIRFTYDNRLPHV